MLALACIALLPTSAHGQSLSLEECLRLAIKQNLQVKAAEAAYKTAEQQIAETRAALFPQISGEYNFTYNPDLPPTFLPGFIVGQPEQENVAAVLGLKQTQYAGMQVSQQLFNPQLFIALKAVKVANQLSELQLIQTKEDIAYNVTATYYNLLSVSASIDMIKASIASFDTTIRTTQVLFKNGLARNSDVGRLTLAKRGLETQLLSLKISESDLMNMLRLLTGIDKQTVLTIEDDIPTDNYLLTSVDTSFINRSDYESINASIDLKELERKSILSSYMPNIVLFGGYFSYAYNADFNPSKRIGNTSFDVSQLGLSLKVSIFDGGERLAKARQKMHELQKLRYQQRLIEQQATNEIGSARQKYSVSLRILEKENETVALARETLEEAKASYRSGFVGVNDVINSENDLQKAQTDYIKAFVNVRLAELEWKKANGTLLKF